MGCPESVFNGFLDPVIDEAVEQAMWDITKWLYGEDYTYGYAQDLSNDPQALAQIGQRLLDGDKATSHLE